MALQLLGFFLGMLGFLGTVAATVLPHWRCSAYVDTNIITAVSYMKGLWMECVSHSTGIYQCELHRSLLALPSDLQAARALMVLSCVTSTLAVLLAVMGMKCTQCAHALSTKNGLLLGGGVCFLSAGLLCLIPVSWTTHSIIQDFYNPFLPSALKYEIGQAIFVGYTSSCLSLIGAFTLCCSTNRQQQPTRYPPPHQMVGFPSAPSPPPAVLAAAPSYRPPEALRGNCVPSVLSVSQGGYRLNDFF
ncbi:claudin-14-like [Gadus chalcogrammus]|uniref:claudin-14-like n=1 Tax=Gadus chalcogrammus TaxID=1042646 RepID=UPI0024C4A4A0|nr:claudin-14-like [Gadus chalcogrammus]